MGYRKGQTKPPGRLVTQQESLAKQWDGDELVTYGTGWVSTGYTIERPYIHSELIEDS